jgi:hypothetical protein
MNKKDDILIWDDTYGVGFCPVISDGVYNESYYNRCLNMGLTETGSKIVDMRIGLVRKWIVPEETILDFGIGSGIFLQTFGSGNGFDVNPVGIKWLKERNAYVDPYKKEGTIDNICFWDSFEHIYYPLLIIKKIKSFIFMSLPIFSDRQTTLQSKHFRPDEHFWYFTHDGLILFMKNNNFNLMEFNKMEQEVGREDVNTYVFKRVTQP